MIDFIVVGMVAIRGGGIVVVCNDGSAFSCRPTGRDDETVQWKELPPIPGTRAGWVARRAAELAAEPLPAGWEDHAPPGPEPEDDDPEGDL